MTRSPDGPTVVLIPVGPDEPPTSYIDTVDSVIAFSGNDTKVLILDDTGRPDLSRTVQRMDRVTTLSGSGGSGLYGGLASLVCRGLHHAAVDLRASIVFRMDADAVMVAPGIEAEAHRRFAADPSVGALGSFSEDFNGHDRDWAPAAELLRRDLGRRGLRHPRWAGTVRKLVRAARAGGYSDGEHALAAAILIRGDCVRRMAAGGWVSRRGGPPGVAASVLGDDHLLGLLVRAVGRRTVDFGRPGEPLAVSWRGLPADPESLLTRGAKVVHSVGDWRDQRELATRAALRTLSRRAEG